MTSCQEKGQQGGDQRRPKKREKEGIILIQVCLAYSLKPRALFKGFGAPHAEERKEELSRRGEGK